MRDVHWDASITVLCVCVCVCAACVCVCVYIHTHTHTHTHISCKYICKYYMHTHRAENMRDFHRDASITVLLATLKSGGMGLNLVPDLMFCFKFEF